MTRKLSYLEEEPLWYKDAIIYELHVKSFLDSDENGIGDFRGLIQKLDYLHHLGVNAVWILPFYPSPLKDDGYDISDYRHINPCYGSLRDFKDFLKEAHKRGIRVITELVLNHTSSHHPWFQKARRAKKGTVTRNYYVWSDSPEKYKDARIIFKDFETSNWTWDDTAKAYYWHRFYSHQPDLNFKNPRVRKEMMRIIDYWLKMGVDGLRLDAVPYLFEKEGTNCENLPETHAFLKEIRSHIDSRFKDKMFLAEANQWPEDAVVYLGTGDESHMAFNFPLMPRIFMAVQMEDRFPIVDILEPPLDIPDSCQWTLFLRNHDELTLEMVTDEERDYMYKVYATDPQAKLNLGIRRRLAPLLGNNRRKIELMNIILFSLPGTPVIYYGDEIGMGDNYYLGDRDGVRTPMQWSVDRNAGFSKANPQKLYLPVIIDPEYHFAAVNVENQERNPSSLLWWMKRVIGMRKKFKAFGRGTMEFLSPRNPRILAFLRCYQDEIVLVVINLSRFSQVVRMDLSSFVGYVPREVFSGNEFPLITEDPYILTIGPHGHFWFSLEEKEKIGVEEETGQILTLKAKKSYEEIIKGNLRRKLEEEVLIPYLKKCRWFGGKGKGVRSLTIVDEIKVLPRNFKGYFLIVQVNYNQGIPEMYSLPLFYASPEEAVWLRENFPQAVVSELQVGEEGGLLYDGMVNPEFHQLLLNMLLKRRKLKGSKGEIKTFAGKTLRKLLKDKEFPLKSSLLQAEQSNTSLIYDQTLVLKVFRKLEFGINPDVEIEKFLTESTSFSSLPPFAGGIQYESQKTEPIFLGFFQGYVPNEGDAWNLTLDNVGRYLERILSQRDRLDKIPSISTSLLEKESSEDSETKEHMREWVGGFYSEMIELLGKRTAQLHLSLYSLSQVPDFKPEAFSLLYQRSVYQSMRSLVRQVFALLESNKSQFSEDIQKESTKILEAREKVFNRLEKVTGKKISAMKIRIHGDYHLGQVLFTGKDFVIIDFEGEPARTLSERRLKRSALRDVAGMVRSFHYAAHASMMRHPSVRPEDREFLDPWLKNWYLYVSRLFLNSYLETVGREPILPKKRGDLKTLLDAFLLEKAVYELGYELNNRPDWVSIPMKGILYILQ